MLRKVCIKCSRLLVVLLMLATYGCGYQLQAPLLQDNQVQDNQVQDNQLRSSLQPIYIDAKSAWSVALQRKLAAQGVKLTAQRQNAASILRLHEAQRYNRSVSVSADGRDAEYLQGIQAVLSWYAGEHRLIDQAPLQLEQTQLANPARRAAQQRESELIEKELIDALAARVLQHMRYAQVAAEAKAKAAAQDSSGE
ncbi:MAG: hypothetical protein HKO71_06025 [Pseudomonadales bacterium]|nr:hypothetical protein [Pseudomonadales bacterium]